VTDRVADPWAVRVTASPLRPIDCSASARHAVGSRDHGLWRGGGV